MAKGGGFDEFATGAAGKEHPLLAQRRALCLREKQERPAVRSALHAARMLAFANNHD